VSWRPWRRKLEQAQEAVRHAESLRDDAERQKNRAEALAPRIDNVTSSLQKLRADNHFGPLIDAVLRGNE
jgi:hypothetical protein